MPSSVPVQGMATFPWKRWLSLGAGGESLQGSPPSYELPPARTGTRAGPVTPHKLGTEWNYPVPSGGWFLFLLTVVAMRAVSGCVEESLAIVKGTRFGHDAGGTVTQAQTPTALLGGSMAV